MTPFNELGLHQRIKTGLERLNFEKPTPIQQKVLTVFDQKNDLIACAETGSGKNSCVFNSYT